MKARGKKTIRPRQAYLPAVTQNALWLESDRYDRRAFEDLVLSAAAAAEFIDTGERLVPNFAALIQDVFVALFRLNLLWLKPEQVRPSAALNRVILESLLPSPAFAALKARTTLEEDKAAIATMALGDHVLRMIRSERLINRREMLDLKDLEHQEDDLAAWAEALKNARRMADEQEREGALAPARAEEIAELERAAERAAQVSEARLRQKRQLIEEQMRGSDLTELRRLEAGAVELAGEIDRVAEDSEEFGRQFGQGARVAAEVRLELGRRLARNRRLGELARLVGRFKQQARALRRRRLERAVAETYAVERGSELGRLIPAELVALSHRALARDLKRRMLEGALMQYRLAEPDQKGKGPMVVCVDVSSSMQGDKELWAKAVCLTLMDIARRQRRLFRAVLFASGEQSLKVLDLNRRRRYEPELSKVLELAEYFPGGGTDFERPLTAAVGLLAEKQLKRGDVVIITDGEAQVSPEWLARLGERKRELDFSIFAVLVDVGRSELSTLARLADRVTTVRRLSDQDTGDIFLKIQAA